MKGDSSLLEPDHSFLAGDHELIHDQATKTSTPKRYDAAYDTDVSSALLKTIEQSVTLGSADTLTSATGTFSSTTDALSSATDPSWHGVVDISSDYDPSQAREELSESVHSVRNDLPLMPIHPVSSIYQ